jgi:hypothetical protein
LFLRERTKISVGYTRWIYQDKIDV